MKKILYLLILFLGFNAFGQKITNRITNTVIHDPTNNPQKADVTPINPTILGLSPAATDVQKALIEMKAIMNANDVTGDYIGSAATLATLPTTNPTKTAENGDWALVNDNNGSQIYVYDGTDYQPGPELGSNIAVLTDAQIRLATDTTVGAVSGKQLHDREQALKGTEANFEMSNPSHAIAKLWDAKTLKDQFYTGEQSYAAGNTVYSLVITDADEIKNISFAMGDRRSGLEPRRSGVQVFSVAQLSESHNGWIYSSNNGVNTITKTLRTLGGVNGADYTFIINSSTSNNILTITIEDIHSSQNNVYGGVFSVSVSKLLNDDKFVTIDQKAANANKNLVTDADGKVIVSDLSIANPILYTLPDDATSELKLDYSKIQIVNDEINDSYGGELYAPIIPTGKTIYFQLKSGSLKNWLLQSVDGGGFNTLPATTLVNSFNLEQGVIYSLKQNDDGVNFVYEKLATPDIATTTIGNFANPEILSTSIILRPDRIKESEIKRYFVAANTFIRHTGADYTANTLDSANTSTQLTLNSGSVDIPVQAGTFVDAFRIGNDAYYKFYSSGIDLSSVNKVDGETLDLFKPNHINPNTTVNLPTPNASTNNKWAFVRVSSGTGTDSANVNLGNANQTVMASDGLVYFFSNGITWSQALKPIVPAPADVNEVYIGTETTPKTHRADRLRTDIHNLISNRNIQYDPTNNFYGTAAFRDKYTIYNDKLFKAKLGANLAGALPEGAANSSTYWEEVSFSAPLSSPVITKMNEAATLPLGYVRDTDAGYIGSDALIVSGTGMTHPIEMQSGVNTYTVAWTVRKTTTPQTFFVEARDNPGQNSSTAYLNTQTGVVEVVTTVNEAVSASSFAPQLTTSVKNLGTYWQFVVGVTTTPGNDNVSGDFDRIFSQVAANGFRIGNSYVVTTENIYVGDFEFRQSENIRVQMSNEGGNTNTTGNFPTVHPNSGNELQKIIMYVGDRRTGHPSRRTYISYTRSEILNSTANGDGYYTMPYKDANMPDGSTFQFRFYVYGGSQAPLSDEAADLGFSMQDIHDGAANTYGRVYAFIAVYE